jgi:hypothetical protein
VTDEETERTSSDLPYELQSKMFDQLAAISVAGAGLTVTLIGSTLANAPGIVWLAVIEFALAAITALAANIGLIDALFKGKDGKTQAKWMTALCVMLIGMAIGSLSMSVYLDGRPHGSSKDHKSVAR